MAVVTGTVLSLVLGDRAAVLAQVSLDKGRRVLQRVGRFEAPAGARLLDSPADHGAALAAYLARHGFTAKKVVAGLPARWLIAQERDLPPVDAAAAADLLRLAAERLSLAESGALVADYAGTPDPKAASRVLLVGMLNPQLDKIRQLVETAGLSLAAAGPTSLAVASLAGGDQSVLRLTEDGAELVLQAGGNPRTLQPLTPDLAALGPEVKRTLTMRGAGGQDIVLSDAVGLTAAQSAELSSRLAAPTKAFGAGLDVTIDPAARNGSAATLPADAHWPAVALAVAATAKRGLPADFLDSKLTVVPPARFGRRTIIAAATVVLAVAGFAWLVSTVNARESEEQRLLQDVADQKQPVADARNTIDQISYGRTYFDTRPSMLDCLKQITLAFNYDEPIWATTITVNQAGRGQIIGRCRDDRNDLSLIHALRDRLSANRNFPQVNELSTGDVGGKEALKSFTIGFLYQPSTPTTAPSTK